MTRVTLAAANAAEVAKPTLRGEYLCKIEFPSFTLRGSTADSDIIVSGDGTYVGNARFVGFSGISETPDLKARTVSIQLSGLDAQIVSAVMNDKCRNAPISLYVVFFNEDGTLVAPPHQLGTNLFLSTPSVRLGDKAGAVVIEAESLEVFNRRNSSVLATPETQKRRFPGDTGLDNVRKIMEMEFEWASRRIGGAGSGGRPSGANDHISDGNVVQK